MVTARGFAFVVFAVLSGCAPKFESPSKLDTLRVLAVQKDAPYARPGETVTMRMLLDDASEKAPRDVQVSWFAGCENPPGDVYPGCFASLLDADGGHAGAPALIPGSGLEFSYPISKTIISRRPPSSDPKQVPYGLSFVFFAACAGEVRFEAPSGDSPSFPLACYSKSGERLGMDDFVAGYSQTFVYDEMTNANPIVTGFELDGNGVPPECTGASCIPLEAAELRAPGGTSLASDAGAGSPGADAAAPSGADAGGGDAGAPVSDDPCATGGPGCIDVCTTPSVDDCPVHSVKLLVDPKSAEHDTVSEARGGKTLLEQMWVNYYSDAGKFTHDIKLLNDSTTGWQEDHAGEIRAPQTTGPFHVWGVAHDNRGGTQWARVRLSTRAAKGK
jgi:hypothetical protein